MEDSVVRDTNDTPPDADAVLSALDKVLASEEFARSPRIVGFFRFVVVETLEGRGDYIKAYTIALEAFGRDEAFDPQLDPVVRVQAVRLRRMLKEYYLTEGKDDAVVIELPRGSYIPIFSRRSVAKEQTQIQGHKSDYFGPSIVVLPFTNLSNNPEQQIFADGITEEIITRLAKFRELYVIARHTANLYAGLSLSVGKIAEELGVGYVMEGSIKRSGNVIRVTARLISGTQGSDIWNETFDRELNVDNLLALQDDIANKIVATIAQPYGVIARKEMARARGPNKSSLDSYKALLGYYTYYQRASQENNYQACQDLEAATNLNPEHAEIWGALACLKADQYLLSFVEKTETDVAVIAALEAAEKGMNLDPDSAICQHGWIWSNFAAKNIRSCHEVAERAVAANPNNTLLLGDWGFALACSGNWDRGLELIDQAMARNPATPSIYFVPTVLDLYRRDQFSQALAVANRIRDYDIFWIFVLRAICAARAGDYATSVKAVESLSAVYPYFPSEFEAECQKWSFEPSLIDSIADGLSIAGVKIP